MRIVQLANFYGARSGGIRTAVDRWGAGYVAAGHEVILVVPGHHDGAETLPTGVHRISVRAPRLPLSGGYRVASPGRVADILRHLRPDALEVSDRLTLRGFGQWARARDIHSTMVSHERLDRLLGIALPRSAARTMADEANRRTARSFDTVVCTTDFAAAEFSRIGATNVRHAPLGVDLEMFDPQHADPTVGARFADETTTLITHCGRLSPEKRADRSIAAIAELHSARRRVHLVVAGDGPRRGALERAARGLPVTFLGHVADRRQVAALLATTEISLAPGPHETFCLSALESLASGTPVVASRSSAVAGLVDPTCGALAHNNAAGFAEAIQQVLEMPRPERESAARRRASCFRWPDSVARMLAIHHGADGGAVSVGQRP
ncbi:glycosyltransferase [Gordonia sp. HNM0687]|uniref:Glycosyltransferase n=1 Tax=Gordonia mangrovi TaxID=2665643 RepID=A0A6L7GU70_9ACTN|nr:glycosyltransferase [Gordonia mangrovi]MXP22611.1 glycosyltransferase [Gordonia mangrovi]UVF77519.1 glycosyltransferase [Gordonia mangrovi]